ncbi:hypothetical protein [Shinella sumterensis]|uniref:hypothetical protein n=1 Tax=Shinella sumterensis TaxID=1967501 RepID=UPI003F83699E
MNIVAACRDCNSNRNQAAPDEWQHKRVVANRLDEAGQDKGFDPAFYSMPNIPLKEQYRFKWHHTFFVELPQWQVEIEAMRLGDLSRAGSAYRTASSIAIVYPLFANEADFNRPTEIYAGHKGIPGAQIMLENPEHEVLLRSVFRNAVVKHE